jgi:DeoR/GlpR family transcriptional regulator of sugar metabolism
VSDLSKTFNVSEATIRRDLGRLQKSGKIMRFHGGAFYHEPAKPEPPIIERAMEQSEEKKKISSAAADLIEDGETVFIGSGTTTEILASNLKGRQNITVITNSLLVVNQLVDETDIVLVQVGGNLRRTERSFIGYLAEQAIKEMRPSKVFIGIRSISLTEGLTSDYLPEVSTDRIIINSAPEVILLADYTKFGKVSTAFVCSLGEISKIITDTSTPSSIIAELKKGGIVVIVV